MEFTIETTPNMTSSMDDSTFINFLQKNAWQTGTFFRVLPRKAEGILSIFFYDMDAPPNAQKLGSAMVNLKKRDAGRSFEFGILLKALWPEPDESKDRDHIVVRMPQGRNVRVEFTVSGGDVDLEFYNNTSIQFGDLSIAGEGHFSLSWEGVYTG